MKTGSWNVRDTNGKEEETVEDMIKHRIEVLGVTEMNKKGKAIKKIHKEYG